MNVVRTLFDKEDDPVETKPIPPSRSERILEVITHYQTYFPRSCPKPSPKSRYWRAISARLNEGFSVEECKQAIDGCCQDPWHKDKKKHELIYIVRNDEQVHKFMLMAEGRTPEANWSEGMFDE